MSSSRVCVGIYGEIYSLYHPRGPKLQEVCFIYLCDFNLWLIHCRTTCRRRTCWRTTGTHLLQLVSHLLHFWNKKTFSWLLYFFQLGNITRRASKSEVHLHTCIHPAPVEMLSTRKYYPSSKQSLGPPTYTQHPSRCSAAKGAELDSAEVAATQKAPLQLCGVKLAHI